MAQKFNRNHTEVQNDKFYLDDYRADLNGLEEDLRTRLQDFERLPCIVSGGSISIPASDSDYVEVSPLVAYDGNGSRIITTATVQVSLIDLTGDENWIVARHAPLESQERQAYYTGATYPSRIEDGGEILCVPPEQVNASDVVLGVVTRVNGENQLNLSPRTPVVAKPSLADQTPPPSPSPVNVSTGLDLPSEDRAQRADLPQTAYVRASWPQVSDASGIAAYEVVWMPVDDLGDPLPDERREGQVLYSESPPRTDFTFHGIPIGQRGAVWVRAVDGAGNRSNYAVSDVITAGGTATVPSPGVTATPKPLGVEIVIAEVSGAAGYEVFVDTADPGTNPAKLFDRGPSRRLFVPSTTGDTLYFRVRAFNREGVYSDTTLASASPNPLTLDEVSDGVTYKRQAFQRIEDLHAEVSAARGTRNSLSERLQHVIEEDGSPSPAVSLRQISFVLDKSVKADFGAGQKDVVVWWETTGAVELHRFHLVQYSTPTAAYTIEIWVKPIGDTPYLLDSEEVSTPGLFEFLHDKAQVAIDRPAQIYLCVSSPNDADAQGVLTYRAL